MNLGGQPNWEEKEIKLTDYVPKSNSQQKSTPDTHIPTSKRGRNGEERAELLRVGTGPECPEGNRREVL